MPITLHLRDHEIDVPNFRPALETSVFQGLLGSGLLSHADRPAYHASDSDDDLQSRSGEHHVFVVHTPDLTPWVEKLTAGLNGHIVFASSLGVSAVPPNAPAARCHACHWKPIDFENPPPRLSRWLEQLKGDDIGKVDWGLLQPEDSEALLAARLLLDAEELHCASEQEVCPGITISRPDAALLAKARRVIETKEAREPLDAAVKDFCEKLGVASA